MLEQLEQLEASGHLDEHQEGLARLLRYRFNWRIREKAVQSLATLTAPEDHIFSVVLEIVADEHTEFDLRTMAADSVCGLISMRQKQGRWDGDLGRLVTDKLTAALNPHQPAGFQRAVKRVLDCAKQAKPHERLAAAR